MEIQKNLFTQDRQQVKKLLTFDMNADQKSMLVDSINVFDCHQSSVLLDCQWGSCFEYLIENKLSQFYTSNLGSAEWAC